MMLYLVRHALPDFEIPIPYHTVPGPPLTEAGLRQADAIAELLVHSGIERVISSPFRRSVMTAEPICACLGLPLETDEDLSETHPDEAQGAVATRVLRAALTHAGPVPVALVSHAHPLEELMLTLTRSAVILPPLDGRGARMGIGHVWQLVRRGTEWRACYLPERGVQV